MPPDPPSLACLSIYTDTQVTPLLNILATGLIWHNNSHYLIIPAGRSFWEATLGCHYFVDDELKLFQSVNRKQSLPRLSSTSTTAKIKWQVSNNLSFLFIMYVALRAEIWILMYNCNLELYVNREFMFECTDKILQVHKSRWRIKIPSPIRFSDCATYNFWIIRKYTLLFQSLHGAYPSIICISQEQQFLQHVANTSQTLWQLIK